MSQVLAVVRKELRAYFLSPVALIFVGTFLLVTLFAFFWVEGFFSRNVADIRPLFTWLPVLLIFLVAALTMRLWSEEQKLGTLETLLTLPAPIPKLVVGKFVAGLVLVAVSLLLTLGVPITVSLMGDLDWGPVIGGYVGALLLAAAYLAVGLCISASTENQIVSLISTCLAGGVLYALGTERLAGMAGNRTAELLRSLGTGSRFESIGRGVLDLRDLAYYGSLVLFFLVLNTVLLEAKRWSQGERTRKVRLDRKLMVALAGANLLVLNFWLAPVGMARVDLTERNIYTVSDVTKDLVRSLDEPLLIRGYFSDKTHPLLAPFVPRIRDLISEYGVLSGGTIRAEFVDPREDEAVEEEANQAYGIQPVPFRVADRYESGIVNSYFSILVKYGDQYEVLGFEDLIEVQATPDDIDVRLRNLEYDLTRTIKKVVYGFQSIDAVFAELPEPAEFTAYITPDTLPENYQELPDRLEKVLKELESRSSGRFTWSVVDPRAPGNEGLADRLFQQYGLRPFATSLFSNETFYFHLLLRVGDQLEQIVPADAMTEADIRTEIEASLRRAAPGFLKTVGLVLPPPPPQMPNQPPQRPPDFHRVLREALTETYQVKSVDVSSGRVPGDVDVLLLVAPEGLDDKKQFAVDQYLMRGGTVVVLGGHYELDLSPGMSSLRVKEVETGLEDLLRTWGIEVAKSMVLDPQNQSFPIPVTRNLGFATVREIQQVRYPFFVDVRRDGMADDSPVVAGLPQVTMHWASPVKPVGPAAEKESDVEVVELLHSSPQSWTSSELDVQPDFSRYPEHGFAMGDEKGSLPLAVALRGRFVSAFADRPSPLFGADEAPAEGADEPDRTGRTIKESAESARLVVVGSSSFVHDQVISLSQQTGGEGVINGLQFVQNLLDWSVEDADLLTIRTGGTFARTLDPMEPGERSFWEWLNYGIALGGLLFVVLITWGRRRRLEPIPLEPRPSAPAGEVAS